MNSIYQKIIKIERGCEISPTTPVEHLVPSMSCSAFLLIEELLVRSRSLDSALEVAPQAPELPPPQVADVDQGPPTTLAVMAWLEYSLASVQNGMPLATYRAWKCVGVPERRIVFLDNNLMSFDHVTDCHRFPPFLGDLVLMVIIHETIKKSSLTKNRHLCRFSSKSMNSLIKNFSFLLSLKTWFEPIVFPGSLAVLKSCDEAAQNFLGQNAFGLIQEYCTISEIASFEGSPRFARRPFRIEFWGQKRIGDFKRRKERFLILNPKTL